MNNIQPPPVKPEPTVIIKTPHTSVTKTTQLNLTTKVKEEKLPDGAEEGDSDSISSAQSQSNSPKQAGRVLPVEEGNEGSGFTSSSPDQSQPNLSGAVKNEVSVDGSEEAIS